MGLRGVCLESSIVSTPCESEPRQELHEAGKPVNRILAGGVLCHFNSINRVKGREPFLVPSHPGTAIENRPAVPPATNM